MKGHGERGELGFQSRQLAPEPPSGPGLVSDKATVPSPSPCTCPRPSVGALLYGNKPKGSGAAQTLTRVTMGPDFSRPTSVLRPVLDHQLGTEQSQSENPQPTGRALEEKSEGNPPHEPSSDSRNTGRDQRRLPGGGDAGRASMEGTEGTEAPEGKGMETPNSPPKTGSSHSLETDATSDNISPLCSLPSLPTLRFTLGVSPPACELQGRVQAWLCPPPVSGEGMAGSGPGHP